MALAFAANFGTIERWREEFVAMGKALGGGSGWVLLMFQPREGTLVNQWAADHTHALAGGVPFIAYRPDRAEMAHRGVVIAAEIHSLLDLPAALA